MAKNIIGFKTLENWYNTHKKLTEEELEDLKYYFQVKADCGKTVCGLSGYKILKAVSMLQHLTENVAQLKEEFDLYNHELSTYRKLFLEDKQTPKDWLELEEQIELLAKVKIFELGKEVYAEWCNPKNCHGGMKPFGQIQTAVNNILLRRDQNAI